MDERESAAHLIDALWRRGESNCRELVRKFVRDRSESQRTMSLLERSVRESFAAGHRLGFDAARSHGGGDADESLKNWLRSGTSQVWKEVRKAVRLGAIPADSARPIGSAVGDAFRHGYAAGASAGARPSAQVGLFGEESP